MSSIKFKSDVVISLLLVMILVGFLKFSALSMPMQFEAMMLVILIVVFLVFAGVIWKEKSRDEREKAHQLAAGRISFLAAAASLVIGIIVQGLNHEIDVWLVFVLVVMILSKTASRIYSQIKN